jgi:hypothetical protein
VTAESALGSVTIFALVALAALVQPLNPDPNAPGVHRSVVEHTPTHRLQARNRRVHLPLYPQGCSSHRILSLACEVPHQSRSHVYHSRAGSDESRGGLDEQP